MPVAFKAIKPNRLNVPGMQAALEAEAKAAADDLELEFQLSTATWDHDVKFEKIVQIGPDSVQVLVDTDDEIYRYVNEGTKPHEIRPKRPGGVLAFPSQFTPKSQPGRQTSGAGSSGGDTIFSAGVHHPGTKARRFDKTIMSRFSPKYRRRMEKAMKDAAKASGHAMEK